MGTINQVSANNYTPAANTVKNDGDNKLHGEKLVFSPSELGLNGRRPATIVLTEKQVETKIFQKYGFDVRNKVQTAMLKLRFDTKNNPASEINWDKGQFVARLNSNGQYEITVNLRERTLKALQGRLINAPSVSNTDNANPNDTISSRTGYDTARIKKNQIQSLPKPDLSGLTPEQKELVLDLTQVGLSVVGIFDPTGLADGADAVISLGRGDYWGAGISALGIIPYLGDLAKVGKLPKLLKTVEKVVEMAKTDTRFAKLITPLLEKLRGALSKIPTEKLPQSLQDVVKSMKSKIDEFFVKTKRPDVYNAVKDGLSQVMASKGNRLIHTPRKQALEELLTEAKKGNISINSDSEAQALLNWAAKNQGVPPENIHAVTIGSEIFVRPQYAENVRVLREELIHVSQQRAGISTDKLVQGEIEARLMMIKNRHKWGMTNEEIREMIKEVRQISRTGRY